MCQQKAEKQLPTYTQGTIRPAAGRAESRLAHVVTQLRIVIASGNTSAAHDPLSHQEKQQIRIDFFDVSVSLLSALDNTTPPFKTVHTLMPVPTNTPSELPCTHSKPHSIVRRLDTLPTCNRLASHVLPHKTQHRAPGLRDIVDVPGVRSIRTQHTQLAGAALAHGDAVTRVLGFAGTDSCCQLPDTVEALLLLLLGALHQPSRLALSKLLQHNMQIQYFVEWPHVMPR